MTRTEHTAQAPMGKPRTLTIAIASVLMLQTAGPLCAQTSQPDRLIAVNMHIDGIMDTDVTLTAVVPADKEAVARTALAAAKDVLVDVEKRMSSHLADSDIGRLNNAEVGKEVALSRQTLAVLEQARDFAAATDGAFDVTCRPLLELWKRAGRDGRLPSDEQLAAARAIVGWKHFKLTDAGAIKLTAGASIDLGGIAKKYAIDRAAEVMRQAGIRGGIVNVGGDIRCFGRRPSPPLPAEDAAQPPQAANAGDGYGQARASISRNGDDSWRVGVRSPFARDEQLIGVLKVREAAVCTSGNYERFVIIDGKHYSHIVDPRTGWPADAVPSVTVVGRDAVTAGVWGTALCVLGPKGLDRLPAGLNALLVTGSASAMKLHMTPDMTKMFTPFSTSGPDSQQGL